MTSKILAIIGARPQFIKHAPVELAVPKDVELKSIHTGQHYDSNMSQVFFDQLNMRKPDYMLEVGSHSHGVQTGKMMIDLEDILQDEEPNAVIVYGDTNSTLAGALVAAKLNIPVVHVEAGMRSYNKTMPEEINRICTDHVSSILLVSVSQAAECLAKEGITKGVHMVGDVMADMVRIALKQKIIRKGEDKGEYYYATIHRPYNTDEASRLEAVMDAFNNLEHPVYFAIHPRTVARMESFDLSKENYPNIRFIEPVSYFENLNYMANARGVITDSGGMQKEAYLLKRKCITVRSETEWVETLEGGWNTLVFEDLNSLGEVLESPPGAYQQGVYGDGHAAEAMWERIVNSL